MIRNQSENQTKNIVINIENGEDNLSNISNSDSSIIFNVMCPNQIPPLFKRENNELGDCQINLNPKTLIFSIEDLKIAKQKLNK